MYQIDLSFLKGSQIAPEGYEIPEEKCQCHIKDIILQCLTTPKDENSTCMAWGNSNVLDVPFDDRNIIEAECSGLLGNHFCQIQNGMDEDLHIDDLVLVKNEECVEIARVIEVGEIVNVKRRICGLYGEILPVAIRKVSEDDKTQYRKNLQDELLARPIFIEKVHKFKLEMKLVNIHYQFDRRKLYFFYTADGRVDFRELAKDLASKFKTRIELRQIGVRDEAKQIGGLGTCGREYCCASFLNNFKRITTQLANEQNLISNMSKLSGPCSKLKCCLSFESNDR